MEKSIRINTNVGSDSVVKVNLGQDVDFLEVLSISISEKNAYKLHTSDYGVIVGRVLANEAFGIPNAKVSVFFALTEEDAKNAEILDLYPYTSVTSKNRDNVRYNLLNDATNDDCYRVVGTFPNKRLVLDNDTEIEIYEKYWKYTTVSNQAGDYMIFGVPSGQQVLHVDIDLSDIGILSQTPRDLIYKGYNETLFENPSQFKTSTNLDNLTQLIKQDNSIYVYPFWGNSDEGEIAITRCDIQVQYKFEPTCIFMGSIVTDNYSDSISHKCSPTEKSGYNRNIVAMRGNIEMIRKTPDNLVEEFQIQGNQLIDGDGVWCYQIPMNLDFIGTDEFGNIIPTNNPNKGIATRTRVRFRVSLQESSNEGLSKHRAKYLIPNNPITTVDDEGFPLIEYGDEFDTCFEFGSATKEEDFRDLYWNKVYSIKSYLPRLQKKKGRRVKNYSGLKSCNLHENANPFPFNRMRLRLNFGYVLLCTVFTVVVSIVYTLNHLSQKFYSKKILRWASWDCIDFDIGEGDTAEKENTVYAPGCCGKKKRTVSCPEDKPNCTVNCDKSDLMKEIRLKLAEEYEAVNLDFYNDWINGCLYFPLWYWKKAKKKKFLGLFGSSKVKNKYCGCAIGNSKAKIYETCALYHSGLSPKSALEVKETDRVGNWHSNHSYYRLGRGIVFEKENKDGLKIYYYTPGLPNMMNYHTHSPYKYFRLYSTDIILLGSLNQCDIDGLPQFFTKLPSTSANIPFMVSMREDANDEEDIEEGESGGDITDIIDDSQSGEVEITGMYIDNHKSVYETEDGLFFSLTCVGIKSRIKSCINVERLCELGVTYDATYKDYYNNGNQITELEYLSDGLITRYEITDNEARAMFASMNGNGLTDMYTSNDTSYKKYKLNYSYPINFDGSLIKTASKYSNGKARDDFDSSYIKFRYCGNNDTVVRYNPRFLVTDNSFYFYFGLNEGKTAIDKFNTTFYAECFNTEKVPFTYSYNISPSRFCPRPNILNHGYQKPMEYGLISVKMGKIKMPYSYTLTNSNGVVIAQENNLTSKEFYIGGAKNVKGEYIKYTADTTEDIEEYKVEYTEGDIVRDGNVSGDIFLENGDYLLTITDSANTSKTQRLTLEPTSISVQYTQTPLQMAYATSVNPINDFCKCNGLKSSKLIISDISLDGYEGMMQKIDGSNKIIVPTEEWNYEVTEISGDAYTLTNINTNERREFKVSENPSTSVIFKRLEVIASRLKFFDKSYFDIKESENNEESENNSVNVYDSRAIENILSPTHNILLEFIKNFNDNTDGTLYAYKKVTEEATNDDESDESTEETTEEITMYSTTSVEGVNTGDTILLINTSNSTYYTISLDTVIVIDKNTITTQNNSVLTRDESKDIEYNENNHFIIPFTCYEYVNSGKPIKVFSPKNFEEIDLEKEESDKQLSLNTIGGNNYVTFVTSVTVTAKTITLCCVKERVESNEMFKGEEVYYAYLKDASVDGCDISGGEKIYCTTPYSNISTGVTLNFYSKTATTSTSYTVTRVNKASIDVKDANGKEYTLAFSTDKIISYKYSTSGSQYKYSDTSYTEVGIGDEIKLSSHPLLVGSESYEINGIRKSFTADNGVTYTTNESSNVDIDLYGFTEDFVLTDKYFIKSEQVPITSKINVEIYEADLKNYTTYAVGEELSDGYIELSDDNSTIWVKSTDDNTSKTVYKYVDTVTQEVCETYSEFVKNAEVSLVGKNPLIHQAIVTLDDGNKVLIEVYDENYKPTQSWLCQTCDNEGWIVDVENKNIVVPIFRPSTYYVSVTQLCNDSLSSNIFTDRFIVEDKGALDVYYNGVLTKWLENKFINQVNDERLNNNQNVTLISWMGVHLPSVYTYPRTDNNSEESLWGKYVKNVASSDGQLLRLSKAEILAYKINNMLKMCKTTYLNENNNDITITFGEGVVAPLTRLLLPTYSDDTLCNYLFTSNNTFNASPYATIVGYNETTPSDGEYYYLTNSTNRNYFFAHNHQLYSKIDRSNQIINSIGKNYAFVDLNGKRDRDDDVMFNFPYNDSDVRGRVLNMLGNYFAAFSNNGGYAYETCDIIPSLNKDDIPSFPKDATVMLVPGFSCPNETNDEANTVEAYRLWRLNITGYSEFGKRGGYDYYFKGEIIDNRIDYSLWMYLPTNTCYSVWGVKVEDPDIGSYGDFVAKARVYGSIYNGVQLTKNFLVEESEKEITKGEYYYDIDNCVFELNEDVYMGETVTTVTLDTNGYNASGETNYASSKNYYSFTLTTDDKNYDILPLIQNEGNYELLQPQKEGTATTYCCDKTCTIKVYGNETNDGRNSSNYANKNIFEKDLEDGENKKKIENFEDVYPTVRHLNLFDIPCSNSYTFALSDYSYDFDVTATTDTCQFTEDNLILDYTLKEGDECKFTINGDSQVGNLKINSTVYLDNDIKVDEDSPYFTTVLEAMKLSCTVNYDGLARNHVSYTPSPYIIAIDDDFNTALKKDTPKEIIDEVKNLNLQMMTSSGTTVNNMYLHDQFWDCNVATQYNVFENYNVLSDSLSYDREWHIALDDMIRKGVTAIGLCIDRVYFNKFEEGDEHANLTRSIRTFNLNSIIQLTANTDVEIHDERKFRVGEQTGLTIADLQARTTNEQPIDEEEGDFLLHGIKIKLPTKLNDLVTSPCKLNYDNRSTEVNFRSEDNFIILDDVRMPSNYGLLRSWNSNTKTTAGNLNEGNSHLYELVIPKKDGSEIRIKFRYSYDNLGW